ncbi:MAG: hypothetical protein ACKOF9_03435 [Burkholderiales bacterium]
MKPFFPASTNAAPLPVVAPALEASLLDVEASLAGLGEALRVRDAVAIDQNASGLQAALARAVDQFALAARSGPIPAALRARLSRASGQVAAQRESLARATAALDRAIEVLIPSDSSSVYSAIGATTRSVRGGMIQA